MTRITGWGAALPEKVLTNADLAAMGLETSDEWIYERSGIRERRVGGVTSQLAVAAGTQALESAGLSPAEIDLLVLTTTTPDQTIPGTSAQVQHELGLRCGAFDLNAACAGFVYALVAAFGFARLPHAPQRVLVIGADTLSNITDWDDRGTAVLFGDGAGAVVLDADGDDTLLGWDLGADGAFRSLLYADVGDYLRMQGREVFRQAVLVMVSSAQHALEHAGITADDLALVVPHQANARIIEVANKRLGIPMERTASVLERTGNTSSASIPLALVDAADNGRLSPGDLVLLVGFGAGMTWATAIIRWDPSGP